MSRRAPTYFRRWPIDRDLDEVLQPDEQHSTPWGAPDHGGCDKCQGTGATAYACRSCLEGGADRRCPACRGRVRFTGVCPACEGDGQIDRTTRDGMSVFPSFEGLCRYIAERDADTAGFIAIELEGDLTGDVDLDADAGALLIRPTRVVGALPFDHTMTAWSRVGATRRVGAS
jgi:hypothetical protein